MALQTGTAWLPYYPAPSHQDAFGTTGHLISWILSGFVSRHHDTALSSEQARCGALDNVPAISSAHVYRSSRSHVYDTDDGLFDLPCDLPNSAVIN